MPHTIDSQCEKPHCKRLRKKTYRDGKGNTLKLCEKHYYRLVSRGSSITTVPDNNTADEELDWILRG